MRVLLDAGASANAKDVTSAALYWAIRRSKTDVARVKLLLDHGASPKLRGTDAFRTALWNPMVEQLVELLVAHGGDVTAKESGEHLLRHACYGSPAPPPHAVDVLLGRKAPHVADSSGRFPLHWAVWWGHVEHVGRLLAHGIDASLLTEKSPHMTPLAMVQDKRNGPAMVAALRAAGAR
jgi:ankyrin repeat protein